MAFLEIRNVSKSFSQSAAAVKDFSLEVDRGELVSFLGPSGCGKTTTLRMVAGFEVPTNGSIFIKDNDVTNMPPNQRNVGMVFQAYALFPNMTVATNIGYGLRIAKKPQAEIDQRVKEMLALVHMADFGDRYPHQLSGGQQQRVALARALAVHPQVLLLDEPLSALDAKIRVSLRGEIRMIQKELGITTIYVTHDQEEALSISDRIVVMNAGKIEQIGTPFNIYNFPQTEFIAQFVGTLNAVHAVVKDAQAGILQIEGRSIKTNQTTELGNNGDQIMISVRPERLSLTSDGIGSNVLEATVENITFLGAIVRIQVSLDKVTFNIDTFNNPHIELPEIKQKVRVAFPEEAVMVLKSNPEK
jgi:putative spermidine/putrescine transport system ATP-binding protein